MADRDEDLSAAILNDRAHGKTVREIARARRMTVAETEKLLDEATNSLLSGAELRRELAAETMRLGELKQVAFGLGKDERDVAAMAVYAKLSERLSTMLGLNAPIGYAVQLTTQAAPRELSSTEQIRAVLDSVRGVTPRELENRERDGDALTPAETGELDAIREARETKRRADHDAHEAARRAARAQMADR